jgi:hypothetical protein
MKKSYDIQFLIGVVLLMITAAIIPQQNFAQRFNHAGGGGARPSMPSMPANRAPAPAPQRTVQMPPAQPPRQTINGGSRNTGNHDFNRPAPTVNVQHNQVVHENVNVNVQHNEVVHENVNVRRNVHENANVYHTGGYRGLRPYAYHPYHPYYWGPRWHPIGFFLSALAANAIRLSIGNQYYYYDDGCYYVPSNGGYAAVPPPLGASVNYLPDGYETIDLGDTEYYYYAGTFYVYDGQNYQVVQAPAGAVVSQLPDGAIQQDVNGQTFFLYNNTYFEPISQDGQDAYQVVQMN